MGQMLEFSDDKETQREVPKSLKELINKGYTNAAFSDSEVKNLINKIGSYIQIEDKKINECCT